MDAWVVEVLREGYKILFSRGPPLSDHQGKSLGEGVLRPTPKKSHRTGSSDSRLLQSPIRSPEGLWVLATHHRPIYPEHFYRVTALPYGDTPSPSYALFARAIG